MKKLRIAIIGCGRVSVVYRQAFKDSNDLIDVCFAMDKDINRARDFSSYFEGCGASDKMEELLDAKPDVVHVCTPHFLHVQHVITCLEAGCHVLTEKPIALSMIDAQNMIDCAHRCNRQLGVIFQNRYIEGVQELKQLIEKGALGALKGAWSHLAWHRPPSYYECDWKGSWEKEGGGVVIDQAIHSIDLVCYLMGCEVTSVQGHIDRRVLTNIEVEDVADAAIRFENGVTYSFFACNYYVTNSPIRIEICGEKGRALLTENEMEIMINGQEPYKITPPTRDNLGETYWGAYHSIQIRDYYCKLMDGQAVPIDASDAAKTLAVVLGIYKSAKLSKLIEMPLT